MSKPTSTAAGREILIQRQFDAPRELVFRAWTQPEQLMRWWAPDGCTTPACTVDLRPGGAFHFCMRMADGLEIWGLGVYREIVAPERIVYTDTFADADGRPVPPSHYGMSESHPAETVVEVTFEERGGGTLLTLRHAIPASVAERDATERGWNDMFDRLAQEFRRRCSTKASHREPQRRRTSAGANGQSLAHETKGRYRPCPARTAPPLRRRRRIASSR